MNKDKLKYFAIIPFILIILFLGINIAQDAFAFGEEDSDALNDDYDTEEQYLRGRVISVVDLEPDRPDYAPSDFDVVAPGDLKQDAKVIITGGVYEGEVVDITNHFSDYDMYRIYLKEGMEVILVDFSGDLSGNVHLHDIARDRTVYYLIFVFAALLLLIGGFRGLKALLTLAFTGFYIIKVLLPLVIQGYSPVLVSVVSAILLVIITLLVIGGINKKSYAAIIGTVTGLLVAGFLSLLVGSAAYLTGLSSQEAQMLFFFDETLNLRELLFAGIIIGALGAIIDVGMSVSSAAAEIKEANPAITFSELAKSAFNVGRDVMATMSNTMILAYVGAAIPLLLLIMSSEMPWLRIINFEFIATEIARGLTISIGLIISVPATAFFAALFMSKRN